MRWSVEDGVGKGGVGVAPGSGVLPWGVHMDCLSLAREPEGTVPSVGATIGEESRWKDGTARRYVVLLRSATVAR